VRHVKRDGFGGQLGLREMAMLYGPRKVRTEPEKFTDKVRRLHGQGLQPQNIATLMSVHLESVLEALRQDVPA
jgi:hypothetical protein